MIFRQLFESDSCTYTYLIACPDTGETLLIDPVMDTVGRDLQVLKDMNLKLTCTLETHVHADHITGAKRLRDQTGCNVAYPAMLELPCADVGVKEGETFRIGNIELHPLYTPGHTDHHHAYLIDGPSHKFVFTGDALLIESCGRTDFQSGSAEAAYHSIHNKLFSLPEETIVYPGHDYEGRFLTSIAQEIIRNPRLGSGKSKEAFIEIMDGLNLPYPRKIDFAVPGNTECGACPNNIPEQYQGVCQMGDQG